MRNEFEFYINKEILKLYAKLAISKAKEEVLLDGSDDRHSSSASNTQDKTLFGQSAGLINENPSVKVYYNGNEDALGNVCLSNICLSHDQSPLAEPLSAQASSEAQIAATKPALVVRFRQSDMVMPSLPFIGEEFHLSNILPDAQHMTEEVCTSHLFSKGSDVSAQTSFLGITISSCDDHGSKMTTALSLPVDSSKLTFVSGPSDTINMFQSPHADQV